MVGKSQKTREQEAKGRTPANVATFHPAVDAGFHTGFFRLTRQRANSHIENISVDNTAVKEPRDSAEASCVPRNTKNATQSPGAASTPTLALRVAFTPPCLMYRQSTTA